MSIHQALRVKEPGLLELSRAYDTQDRDSFIPVWSDEGGAVEWSDDRFALEVGPGAVTARGPEREGLTPELRYAVAPAGLQVDVGLRSVRARRGRLAMTLNLGLHVAEADDRWLEIDGQRADPPHWGARASHASVAGARFVDGWAKRALTVRSERPARFDRAPIETVSLSEAGAERVFQGVETVWTFDVDLAAEQPWSARFTLTPGDLSGGDS